MKVSYEQLIKENKDEMFCRYQRLVALVEDDMINEAKCTAAVIRYIEAEIDGYEYCIQNHTKKAEGKDV